MSEKDEKSPKRFQISASVKKDIKNALILGQNGKVYFKDKWSQQQPCMRHVFNKDSAALKTTIEQDCEEDVEIAKEEMEGDNTSESQESVGNNNQAEKLDLFSRTSSNQR